MNWKPVVCLSASLLMMPLAYAHDPMGTPKNYCESWWEWDVHDWNSDPPSTRFSTKGLGTESSTLSHPSGNPKYQWPYKDGNVQGNCDGGGLGVAVGSLVNTNPSNPCPGDWWLSIDLAPVPPPVEGVCLDLFAADYDGHKEFGFLAHALILVESGVGVPSSDPSVGAGSLYCWHEWGHHPAFGPVAAYDIAIPFGVPFTVYTDNVDLLGIGEGCGDFEFDGGEDCIDFCYVTFPPGLDGAYHVVVTGTQGHVIW